MPLPSLSSSPIDKNFCHGHVHFCADTGDSARWSASVLGASVAIAVCGSSRALHSCTLASTSSAAWRCLQRSVRSGRLCRCLSPWRRLMALPCRSAASPWRQRCSRHTGRWPSAHTRTRVAASATFSVCRQPRRRGTQRRRRGPHPVARLQRLPEAGVPWWSPGSGLRRGCLGTASAAEQCC